MEREMLRYCLDSNAVTDILRQRSDVMDMLDSAIKSGSEIFIPSIAYYEIVRGLRAVGSTRRLADFYAIYENFKPLFIDRNDMSVIEKAADIYVTLHKGRQIEDNDIYIAAISLVNDCILVTSNTRHFERVAGLRIVNWRDT